MLTVPSHVSQNLFENNKSKINLSQFLIESFKDISKVFVNPQSQVIINQKFEKYISVSIYHYQQKVLYEFSLCTEPSSKMFYRKAVLKNFLIFAWKHLIRKSHQHRCFSVNIANVLRAPILKNICKGCFCLLHIRTMNDVILWYVLALQCYFILLCALFLSLLFLFLFSVQSTTMWSIEVNLSVSVIKWWSCLQFCF